MSYMKNALLESMEENLRQVTMELGHKDTAFFIYLDNMNQQFDDLWRKFVDEFEDSYVGYYESDHDFFADMLEQSSIFDEVSSDSVLRIYFDLSSWGRDLFLGGDYWRTDGHYFRGY